MINKLTSLESLPREIDKDFYCRLNPQLTKEEILKYKNSRAVKGK